MAAFNYKCLTNGLVPITLPSASLFVSTANTSSFVRSIILHNVSASTQTVNLWLAPSGALTPMLDAYRFLNVGISGSSTFLLELGVPGMIVTQSGASIYASTTNDSGINCMIVGGSEE